MRWVSLSTDAAPTYAVLAPVTAWLWELLGYRAIVFVHDDHWDNPFGRLVLAELADAGAVVSRLPTMPPLSIANTMRPARLMAAALDNVLDDDFVLTADVDMFPLSPTFFDRTEDFIALRALYHVWEMPSAPIPPTLTKSLAPGEFLFAMCYFGARARIWREMFDLRGSPEESLRLLVPSKDWTGCDEWHLSRRALSYPRASGPLEIHGAGVYKQGQLHLVDPIESPNLSGHEHLPRGLIWLGEWSAVKDRPEADHAIDFIPPRFTRYSPQWWVFDVARRYFPALRARIDAYELAAKQVIDTGWRR